MLPSGKKNSVTNGIRYQATSPYIWLIFIILTFSFSLLYPALNWPDEAYKISTIYKSDNIYLKIIDSLQGNSCSVSYSIDPRATFGSNKLSVQILSGDRCYLALKTINASIIILLSYLAFASLRGEPGRVFLYSLIWPASMFYMTSVNNQVIFHIVSILLGVHLAFGGRRLSALFIALFLLPIDRSFISLATFIVIREAISYSRALVFIGLGVFVLAFALLGPALQSMLDVLMGDEVFVLENVIASNDQYRDNFALNILLLLGSFVYLGGLAAVFGFGFDYIFCYVYSFKRFVNLKERKIISDDVISLLATMLIIYQAIPTISTFRYYVFVFPALFVALVPVSHRKYYVVYCTISCAVYILLANTVQQV